MREPEASRRSFLLSLIASAALYGAGIKPELNRFTGEMGRTIPILKDDRVLARDLLIDDAKKHLPRDAKFDIRLGIPNDYGRNYQMGWYADEKVQLQPEVIVDSPEWVPSGGYYLFGRYHA
jgi:hypothetical protein